MDAEHEQVIGVAPADQVGPHDRPGAEVERALDELADERGDAGVVAHLVPAEREIGRLVDHPVRADRVGHVAGAQHGVPAHQRAQRGGERGGVELAVQDREARHHVLR